MQEGCVMSDQKPLALPAAPEYAALPEGAYFSGAAMAADVLVGRVRDLRQLCACLACGFYHIPAAQMRAHLPPTSHVALYLPSFGDGAKEGIYYLGRVVHAELVRRREIDTLPKNSKTPYYRFTVDGWHTLKPAIVCLHTRAAPYFYTSRFLIAHSTASDMLLLRDEDEWILFSQLRRLADCAGMHARYGFYCGHRQVVCDGESFFVREGKRILGCFSVRAFSHAPYAIFRRIRRLLAETATAP